MTDPNVRRFDEPRPVEVLHDGRWVPAMQDSWVRWPDGDWRASVTYSLDHDWGRGKYLRSVPADDVRAVTEPTPDRGT